MQSIRKLRREPSASEGAWPGSRRAGQAARSQRI